MIHLMRLLPKDQFKPRYYIIANTDTLSERKVYSDIEQDEEHRDNVGYSCLLVCFEQDWC